MSPDRDDRTRLLLGEEALRRLKDSRVLIAGAGGVGGYVAEMLCRTGVGSITLADSDAVDITNINRQIIATLPTVGERKTELFRQRFAEINPDMEFEGLDLYLTPGNIPEILDRGYDFVADAIDTIAPKGSLIMSAAERNIPLISSMGAGGRLDPSRVRYGLLSETRDDGLARAVRNRLRKSGFRGKVPVVWSEEIPSRRTVEVNDSPHKLSSPGSTAFVPATFGIYMASYIVRKLTEK